MYKSCPRPVARILFYAVPLAMAAGAFAQDAGTGPDRRLSFSLDQRLSFTSNPDLSPTGSKSETLSSTSFTLGFESETPADRIALSASGVLRAGNAVGRSIEIDDKRLNFAYNRTAASGEFKLSAAMRDANIRYLRPLEDFLNPDTGEIELPEDAADLSGSGTRRTTSFSTSLRMGDQARFGVTLKAGLSKVDYIGATSAGLVDNKRQTLGADFRFSIDDLTSLTVALSQQNFTSATTVGTRRTDSLSFALRRELVNGNASLSYSISEKPGNIRSTSLSVGRDFEGATSSFGFTLGTSKTTGGNSNVTGSLRYSRELPNGALNVKLNRGITTASDDTLRLSTLLSASYAHEIGPTDRLSLSASWSENSTPGGGSKSVNSSLGITYSREVLESWDLNAGLTHRTKNTSSSAGASSNTIFLGLSTKFE